MADDWDVVSGPGASSGYLSDDEFALTMDSTFGPGNWNQTGGWRSQARENTLRAQGAQTVAPGHTSQHTAGDVEAPGARDIVVKGMTPEQAAARLRQNNFPASSLLPEGAAGTQGAHLHIGMGEDPWAVADDDGWEVASSGQPAPAKPKGQFDEVNRMALSAAGGAISGFSKLLHGLGLMGDAAGQAAAKQGAETGYIALGTTVVKLTPEQREMARQEVATNSKAASPSIEPTAKAWQVLGEEIAPKGRNLPESIAHGAGEMAPAMGAAMVNPIAGAGAFAVQGYADTYDDAIAHGATPEEARRAAAENAEAQGALGLVPVGEGAAAVTQGIKGAIPRVAARYGVQAAGNATLMGAMQADSNVIAQQNYDPDRQWYEQVPAAMAQGALADIAIHGTHDAIGAGVSAAKNALRPREVAPGAEAQAAAESMPTTDAIRAYAGKGPSTSEPPQVAPEDAFEQRLIRTGTATANGQTYTLRRHANPNETNGQYEISVSSPGNAVQGIGSSRPLNSVDDAARFAAQAAFPDANLPDHPSTWTPEREARWQEWARQQPGAAPVPGDPVLFQTPAGIAHGTVVDETPDGRAIVDTPAGRVAVPPDQAVPLPRDYEAERVAAGAPLEQMPQAIADVDELRKAAPRGYSLFQAMKDLGGIRTKDADGSPIGDVQQILDKVRRPGLINNKGGLTPDAMREALQERGWFGAFDQSQGAEDMGGAKPGDSINELYDLMGREASGRKVLHPTEDGTAQRRADLEEQMRQAGVALSDAPETAAAKLAAWRGEQVMATGQNADDLRARAQELGIQTRADATYDELLADVLEREAIQAEADGHTGDAYEDRIDHVLTPEEHEWLAEAGRRSEGEPEPAFPFEPPGRETWDLARAEEGAGEPRAGAESGGEIAPGLSGPDQLKPSPSYVVVDRETGRPIMETFERKTAEKVNRDKYEVLTAQDWLARVNREAREAREQRQDEQFKALQDKVKSERVKLANGEVEQTLIPGAEGSAKQAAEARGEGPIRAKGRQKEADEGLFAPPPEAGLFDLKPTAPTPEARQAAAEAQPKGYGESNRIFTKERADEARKRLRDKLRNQLNAGLDPDLIRDGVELAGYHIEAGARAFIDYARAMLDDLGEHARPYLKMWYESVRHYPGIDAKGMTPTDAITPEVVAGVGHDVSGSVEDLERRGEAAAAADRNGQEPVPPVAGAAERGPGPAGAGNGPAGSGTQGGLGLPDRGAAPVGEPGAAGARAAEPGPAGQPAGRGQPGGGGAPRDEGIQPDRLPAGDLAAASSEAAHLEPVAADAHPFAESVNAPPVSAELERALPLLFPEQRGDVAFAEERFAKDDGHGVLFTNGTGTGKTFTGGGIAKRFYDRGKKNILIVAPSQGILSHWVEAMEKLGVPFHVLEDTSRAGEGPVGTTYAGLTANETLADRKWDLVIADEAHTLSSDQNGSETTALKNFRALTLHPDRLYRRAEMEMRAEVAKVDRLKPPKNEYFGPNYDRYKEAADRLDEKLRARVDELKALDRPKAAFLSATPFAYDKSIEWAHGYLFDWGPEPQSRGYNKGDAKDQFFMRHFGYRMRYNKLTKPEAAVESEIMERQFHEWLRRSGSLSGRVLNVDKDYDRKFALVHGGVGQKIDEALDFLRNGEGGKFRNLGIAIDKQFDYLSRARLLEAIKAKAAIPIIRQHHALGRKVVVFHNFNEGGGFSPFEYQPVMERYGSKPGEIKKLHEEFVLKHPYVREIDQGFRDLTSPIHQLTGAFKDALVYNGAVSKGQRERAKALFNTDGSPNNLIIVQSDAGQAGISLHDTTGKHQRVLMNLGLPVRPTAAIQQEGRIYRLGQKSDAIFRYLNTGTAWERYAFASKIAERAGTAENLALGEQSRTLRESFINAFLDSAEYPPEKGEGQGGKKADFDLAKAVTDYQKARSYYFAEAKKSGKRDQREGLDYFPTPEPLGLKMTEWADIRPGERVLEPSAGHGAIARFFPETADRTLIEPSAELASKAGLHAPGARVLQERFEDLHPVNKFDAIVMNPPFGHAGATAGAHLEKAMGHLKDGGRIVALLPRGATDAKLEKLMESDAAKNIYKVADIALPPSTFERAGTKVSAHVVVLERQDKPELARGLQEVHRDFSDAGSINDLFDRLEHSSVPERLAPKVQEAERTEAEQGRNTGQNGTPSRGAQNVPQNVPSVPLHGGFDLGKTIHGKTGEPVYVATAKLRVSPEEYNSLNALAKKNGGYYSSFRGRGAIPGFQFKSEAQRNAFLADAGESSAPKFAKAPVFYSALERHIDNSTLKAATPDQWKATIRNAPGLKKEELEWTGVNDWLDLFGQDKVPKEALQAFIRDNGVKVKEKVLGDPVEEPEIAAKRERFQQLADQHGEFHPPRPLTEDERAEMDRLAEELAPIQNPWLQSGNETQYGDWTLPGGQDYRELLLTLPKVANPPATHWDTPGVMAHVRFDTRTAPDGKKVLFVQEVQSDWHQKGRDQGYATPALKEEVDRLRTAHEAAAADLTAKMQALREGAEAAFAQTLPHLENDLKAAQAEVVAAQANWETPAAQAEDALHGPARRRLREAFDTRNRIEEQISKIENARKALTEPGWYGNEIRRAVEQAGNALSEESPLDTIDGLVGDANLADLHVNETLQALRTAERGKGIPDAPFKSSWPALVMKRVIRWAVDHDFDRVAWTTGEQQAERYDLTRHVGRITLHDNQSGGIGRPSMEGPFSGGHLIVHDPHGNQVLSRSIADEKGLRETLGNDLSDRILAAPPRESRSSGLGVRERHLEGLDVKIGGEGMKAFYDRNLVNITNDLIKKYGAKVEPGKVRTGELSDEEYAQEIARLEHQIELHRTFVPPEHWSDFQKRYAIEDENRHADRIEERLAQVKAGREKGLTDQHGFDITPQMKEAASGGLPLFKRRGAREIGPAARQPTGVRVNAGTHNDFTDRVAEAINKIAPFAEVIPARNITETATGDRAMGVAWRDGLRHLVAWSIESPDPVGIGRHEAVHALRDAGVFRPEEWDTLERAAVNEDWRERYDIRRRYGELDMGKQLEEAVAERFREWRRDGERGVTGMVQTVFQRLAKILDAIKDIAKRTFGGKMTAADVFSRMESGEIGRRMGREFHEVGRENPNDVGEPAFARGPADEEPWRPEGREPPEAKEVKSHINRILGQGADRVGRKMQSAAAKALPDPMVEALHDTRDAVNMAVNPMAAGSTRAQAAAKDFANALRVADYQHEQLDKWLDRRFTPEQQRRMWEAADEHGVLLRRGIEPGPGQGLNRLDPAERAAVEELQRRADEAFDEASALGMVKGDGLESYVPRMIVQMTAFGPKVLERASPRQQKRGGNLSTTTGQLRQRKYELTSETEAAAEKAFGGKATVVRNIRTLPLATQRLERAIAGRTLINRIKELSSQTGENLVAEGEKPSDHYFTMDHPAMQVWRPDFVRDPETGKVTVRVDQAGEPVFVARPLWISREFEGPLKAVLATPTGPLVKAFAELKAKMMGVIMYSPLMHNAVIWGRALAADPVGVATFEAYRRGGRAKADPETMAEAMNAGLVPITRHFDKIDTASIANNGASFVPGRSWTSQVLGFIPGLFSKEAGDSVKVKVDEFGDLWHNTFLWDRVGDLQMGLYVKIRDDLARKANQFGITEQTAQRIAAHYANRYAGSLPMEGMSKVARQIANWLLFSRSFTLGNAAAFKDVVKGLPSDVRSQIERDAGVRQLEAAQGVARRKAIAMLALDAVFAQAGLWLAAGAVAFLTHQRFQAPTDNEDKYKNRFLLRYQSDGTAIYGRLPTGKTVEDQWHWLTQPVTTFKQKMSPYARLAYEIVANDKGFGKKLYDPYDHTPLGTVKNVGRIVGRTMESLAPVGQIQGAHDLVTGHGDRTTAALQAFLPAAGITVSKGAPGGPAMGDYFAAKDEHDFQVQQAMPDIQRQIKSGDIAGARAKMNALGIAPGLQNYYVRVAQNPGLRMSGRKLRDFERFATDQQRQQFARDQAAGRQ